MGKTKAESSPAEWKKHLAQVRAWRQANLGHVRAQRREYASRPEVKALRRLRDNVPDRVAKRRTHAQTTEAKAAAKIRYETRKATEPAFMASRLASQRRRRTGVTPEMLNTLLKIQRKRCAICGALFGTSRICADHDHQTGEPRGLLCHFCNTLEGMLRTVKLSPLKFADRLMKYLAHPPALRLKVK